AQTNSLYILYCSPVIVIRCSPSDRTPSDQSDDPFYLNLSNHEIVDTKLEF
ncbi:10321_t:CDS:2, partial [Scutellospora calospora]